MNAYYPSLLRLTLWTPVEPCRRHTCYGHSNKLINYMYMHVQKNSVHIVHWVTMNCGFQNGSAFQNGSLEWNFRMEVHSRVEF